MYKFMHKCHHSMKPTPTLALYNSEADALFVSISLGACFLTIRLSWLEFIAVTTLANMKARGTPPHPPHPAA